MTEKHIHTIAGISRAQSQRERLGNWAKACNAVGGQTSITVMNLTRFPCKISLQVAGVTYRQAFLPSTHYCDVNTWVNDNESDIETESDVCDSELDSYSRTSSSFSKKLSRVSSVCSVSSQEQWMESKKYQNQYGTKCSLGFSPNGESPLFTVATLKCGYAWYTVTAQRYKISDKSVDPDWVEEKFICKKTGVYGGRTITLKEVDDFSGNICLEDSNSKRMIVSGSPDRNKEANSNTWLEEQLHFHSEPAELHQTPLAEEIAEKIFSELNFGLSAISE
mmetsp:Transcript_11046/g.13814  ORF Transcript_11046/g.13814 Transcript_11046/m.13814 type:complete len:278 (-) Transcript_11046:358-1191(-)|eukprot:CAMPEP_0204881492 /NCGR_PEP_ID=MMETSP1349-20130617/2738_1 /ASSEMBLY_ACC=CAM_ASM_000710 /TAXON_ID=215587 /ORGANISM="Aplanochytrium stocchinoi, Strain GSBS06" /LENGTH=277 /DNA_ID=CAMNT_0052040459 /DNA_START=64 /DNA_END=897 /DNA_ORIENTATION=-